MTMVGAPVARLIPNLLRERRLATFWFAAQAFAVAICWPMLLVTPEMHTEPIVGRLAGPELWSFGAADMTIVVASAVASIAIGHHCRNAWLAMLVTAATSVYPTVYLLALALGGNGGELTALLMVNVTLASTVFAVANLPVSGRLPGRTANAARTGRLMVETTLEVAFIWTLLLWLAPMLLARIDEALGWATVVSHSVGLLGFGLIGFGGSLLVWSAYHMTWRGRGTPFPLEAPRLIVRDGPYRYVRNPQVVGGLIQGIGLLLLNPTLTFAAYVAGGVLVWQLVLRPWEEADLLDRFGEEYAEYRERVPCWCPQLSPRYT